MKGRYVMETVNYFTDTLNNGCTFNHWQADNGMYHAEIIDKYGIIESVTIKKTLNEIWRWIKEHE
jgi:hypothetical protein